MRLFIPLLMGADAKGIDLFASGDVPISSRPFPLGRLWIIIQQIANQLSQVISPLI